MSRDALGRFCEKAILALVAAMLLFGPLAVAALGAWCTLILQWLAAALLLIWGTRLLANPSSGILWPPICWAVLVFLLYALGLSLFADIKYAARQEFVSLLAYASIFFITANCFSRSGAAKVICFPVIALAALIAGYAIYQFVTKSFTVWGHITQYRGRASGTYVNPNHLAGFLEMIAPVALAWAITGRLKPVARILLLYAVFVMLGGIAVTLSRGSWLSIGVSFTALFAALCFDSRYRAWGLVLLSCTIVIGVAIVPGTRLFEQRASGIYQAGKIESAGRFEAWNSAVKMWRDNVVWGVGPGHFARRFHAYRSENNPTQPLWVHNDYLNTLVDFGVVGAVLAAAVLCMLLVTFGRAWMNAREPGIVINGSGASNRVAVTLGAGAGLVAIFCHSFVDFNLHIIPNALTAATLAGLIAAQLRHVSNRYTFRRVVWATRLAGVIAVGTVLYMADQAARGSIQTARLQRAARLPAFSPEQAQMLEKAFKAQPNADTAREIAECYRRQSQEGGESYRGLADSNYRTLAERALEWYGTAIQLNRWDDQAFLGRGWCLDWLGRAVDADAAYSKAEELDPNGYITVADIGLHYVERGDFAAGRSWFERSLRLKEHENPIATEYRNIVNTRLFEAATNRFGLGSIPGNDH